MANDLNRCEFIGRLGRNVESRYTSDGKAVANFSIAVGSQWKSKDGAKQEATEWVNLVAYDKLAEICSEYLSKGSQVYVSGKIKTRKWQAKDGQDKYTTEVIVEQMQMLGGKSTGGPDGDSTANKNHMDKPAHANAGGGFSDFDSDIPF